MTKEKYSQAQEAFIDLTELTVGSKVKILRKAKSYEHGWDQMWYDAIMDKRIGNTLSITNIHPFKGIQLDSWNYPFFVLEVISNPKKLPDPIPLNSNNDYRAFFNENGDIEVGCQTISFDTLKKIYDTANTLRGGMNIMDVPDGIYETIAPYGQSYDGIKIRIEGDTVYRVKKGDTLFDRYSKGSWRAYKVRAVVS